jgi:hypothetical protein
VRGGFVACLGGNAQVLERIAEHMRWHRGKPARHHCRGVEIAAFVDAIEGPIVETRAGTTTLVHGSSPAPLAELQRSRPRFAALEWDGRILRASRDPLGLAPLFYRVFPGSVWLATEVAPLISLETPVPDLDALAARAAFVPIDERTGWRGIYRILPGCTIEIAVTDLRISASQYWSPARLIGTYRGSRSEALADFRQRFEAAVKRCYEPRSAILFSGGVDSATVAVTARSIGQGPPHLVHVHFPDLPVTHEERYAAVIADAVGAPLHTVPGEVAPWNLDAEFDRYSIPYNRLPYGLFEPALSHIAAAGITVAVDGHDGDGVLGPRGAEWGGLVLKGEMRRLATLYRLYGAMRVFRGIASDFIPPFCRPTRPRLPTPMQSIARYFCDPLRAEIVEDDIHRWRWPSGRWKVRQLQPVLPRSLIGFEQKELEGACYGIDLRHPFADRDLVEFLVSLPCAIKGDPVRAKHLLVEAFNNELPEIIHDRTKSDYMAVVRHRVDPAWCIETIRASKIRLPHVDYARLLDDGEHSPETMPIFLLINLARVHEFARRAA